MRIRSIKPEFWRSDDITSLSIEDRLLFIGLWSYVDDNGVGRDKLALITADLFAVDLSRDPRETLARVSRGLQELSRRGLIRRYEADGTPLLEIINWERHQRIDKPAKARYRRYDPIRDTLATSSRDSRETLATPSRLEQGTEEQGTEEQGTTFGRALEARAPDNPVTTQTLVGEWIDHCAQRPPGKVIGQIAREVKVMLDEGIPYDDVRAGLAAWQRKGIHPSALASVVHEIRNPRQPVKPTTDDRVREGLELAAQLEKTFPADLDDLEEPQIGA